MPEAAYLLLRRDGRLLLLRRAPDIYMGGLLGPPAGKCDPGEDVVDTAVRELREEVGVEVGADALRLVRVLDDDGWRHFFFEVDPWSGEPRNLEPEKCTGLVWGRGDEPDVVPYVRGVLTELAQPL